MPHEVQTGKCKRMSFSNIEEVLAVPDLTEIQKDSYSRFLKDGLKEAFDDISPITDYSENLVLEFVDYNISDKPKYEEEECKERDVNYAAPLKVKVRLINKETGEVKVQEVFMGDFPLMTDKGTFIINGAERVIVSQLVRSPGVYYDSTMDKSGKSLYTSTVIPNRGAWLEYETDSNDCAWVRIDRTRKLPITVLLRAMGLGENYKITEYFGDDERLEATFKKDSATNRNEGLIEIYKRLRPGEPPTVESASQLINSLFFDHKRYDLARVGRFKFNKKLALAIRIQGQKAGAPIVDEMGEVYAMEGEVISEETAWAIQNAGINSVTLMFDDGASCVVSGNHFVDPAAWLKKLSLAGKVTGRVCASDVVASDGTVLAVEGDTITEETAIKIQEAGIAAVDVKNGRKKETITGIHFTDPFEVGLNEHVYYPALRDIIAECGDDEEKFKEALESNISVLIPKHIIIEDMFASVSYLFNLKYGLGHTDDIDHLGNRRLRSVGELLQNQIRVGLSRLERVVRERMSIQDMETATPSNLINIRPVTAAVKEFFGSSQLSQFMDQTNPLAELTHKRRLSALGPGGLNRDRASFEVRDVHHSHYGRMCPIETPEGPNIGLIGSLSTYARTNEYGFIESPYRVIDKETNAVTSEIRYMTADIEDNYIVAQANEPIGEDGRFVNDRVLCRFRDQFVEVPRERVDLMDVSPRQLISVATGMIPFLENDDANRALMGSNMQRQAVPLLIPEAPIVGTGIEYKAAYDSGVVIIAKEAGIVKAVAGDKITILQDDGYVKEYKLIKFARSNQGTCINQLPLVHAGERVEKGQVLADGPSTDNGELALGKNILMGFMTWEGYNYEDAVLISERLVKDDVFTSIHIEEYEAEARDTKLGAEEITRDIPNVGDDALRDLDANGIIRIGAEVRSGDILVGKVTPKGETELTAEERLLRAIFGEKAREVRDTSLRVPHGEGGIIVDVKIFTRENKDELNAGVNKMVRVYIAQKRKVSVGDKVAGRHGNKGVISRVLPQEDMPFLPDGTPLDIVLNPLGVPSRMNIGQVLEVHLGMAAKKHGWHVATPVFDGATEEDIEELFAEANKKETCRRLSVEAGMSEEMIESLVNDGFTPELEAAMREKLGEDADSAIELVKNIMHEAIDGKTVLYDGRSGEPFENRVTVGYMYIMKLHHLVDDKIHARSTGPYSLVTQQPLGGKAQFGGQRFGEMEVWALEAYGAANTLQEILTVKSDDVVGRVKAYEAIVKGENIPEPGVPESFKVLIKEMQSLCLDVKVMGENVGEIQIQESDEDDTVHLGVNIEGNEDNLFGDDFDLDLDDNYDVDDDSDDDDEDDLDDMDDLDDDLDDDDHEIDLDDLDIDLDALHTESDIDLLDDDDMLSIDDVLQKEQAGLMDDDLMLYDLDDKLLDD